MSQQDQYATLDESLVQQPPAKKSGKTKLLVGALALVAVAAVIAVVVTHKGDDGKSPKEKFESKVLSFLDRSVDPCDDFYRFSCGAWIDKQQLTPDVQEVVASFSEIGIKVQEEVREVMRERYPFLDKFESKCVAAADNSPGQELTTLFGSIDTEVHDLASFLSMAGKMQGLGMGFGAVLQWQVMQNVHDARTNEMFLFQNGLSFDPGMYSEFPVDNYTLGVGSILDHLEEDGVILNATQMLEDLVTAEDAIFSHAKYATTFLDTEVPDFFGDIKNLTVAEFVEQTGLDLTDYLAELSPDNAISNVWTADMDVWQGIAGELKNATLFTPQVMRSYLKWRIAYGSLYFYGDDYMLLGLELGQYLGADAPYTWPTWPLEVTEPEQFRGALNVRVPPAFKIPSMRHNRGRGLTPAALDERNQRMRQYFGLNSEQVSLPQVRRQLCAAVAANFFDTWYMHQYLVQDFPTYDRDLANRLVTDTISHLRERLTNVHWLDNTTRVKALEKLEHLQPNVANDPFEGTAGLALNSRDTPFDMFSSVVAWRLGRSLARAGGEYNRTAYQGPAEQMPPWVQNAFYQPTSNTINMLPGLMLPPMFSPELPYDMNVATYVMVIGHECTHGYDNSGRLFGPYGAYENWWTNASIAQFDNRTQCLVDQYSAFSKYGIHVNGSQTLGENIADGGGVDMSWSVYKSISPQPESIVKGFTADQLHFLAYAQTWCTKETEAAYRAGIIEDVHSPDEFRIRGPLSNFEPFADAFGCRADQYYGRSKTDKQCVVW